MTKHETTEEAIAAEWKNVKNDGKPAPSLKDVFDAIAGPSDITKTTRTGKFAVQLLSEVVKPSDRDASLFRIEKDFKELYFIALDLHTADWISRRMQKEANRTPVVSPIRALLLAMVQKGLHNRKPVPASKSRIEVGRSHAVSRIPKFHDIASKIHFRRDLNAGETPDGVRVSDMYNAEKETKWMGGKPRATGINFYPRTFHLVNYSTGKSRAQTKDMTLHANDVVNKSLIDTLGDRCARGNLLADSERIAHLAMALQDNTLISVDMVLQYLIKPSNRNLDRWTKSNTARTRNALEMARALHVNIGKFDFPAWIIDVRFFGMSIDNIPLYTLGRAEWLAQMMAPKSEGSEAAPLRLTGALFRRFDSAGASPLIPRFYTAAEQILSYSGALVPLKQYKESGEEGSKIVRVSEGLHPDNRGWWAGFTVEHWAEICGIKYDAAIPKRKNSVYSKMYQVLERILETQSNHASTIEFRKPTAKNMFIEFRATPMYIEAHRIPKRRLHQVVTLSDLIKRMDDYE